MTEEEMMDLALRLSEQEASITALRLQKEEEAMMKAIHESVSTESVASERQKVQRCCWYNTQNNLQEDFSDPSLLDRNSRVLWGRITVILTQISSIWHKEFRIYRSLYLVNEFRSRLWFLSPRWHSRVRPPRVRACCLILRCHSGSAHDGNSCTQTGSWRLRTAAQRRRIWTEVSPFWCTISCSHFGFSGLSWR